MEVVHRSSSMPIEVGRGRGVTFDLLSDAADKHQEKQQQPRGNSSNSSERPATGGPKTNLSEKNNKNNNKNNSSNSNSKATTPLDNKRKLVRQKTAPGRVDAKKPPRSLKSKSSRGMSSFSVYPANEEEMIEVYIDDEAEFEPNWEKLMTPAMKRSVTRALEPSKRKNKGGEKCAALILQHWLHLKKLQLDASNPYNVQEQNMLEVPAELLLCSPTLEEYTDGLVTICKMKSGGVWDVDQKVEILVGVYGRKHKGMLDRDELAEVLHKHAKVKPGPPPPHFDNEEKQIEYERKVKRGEIVVERHMTQQEYELYLYRWLKKESAKWPNKHGFFSLKTIIKGLEANEKLCDHFGLDLMELAIDMKANDDAKKEELAFVSISEATMERFEKLWEQQHPERARKKKREEDMDFGDALAGMVSRGGSRGGGSRGGGSGGGGKGKQRGAVKVKKKKQG